MPHPPHRDAGARETSGLEQGLAEAGDGAFVIGPDGRIVTWNRAAERILGYAARYVVGRPCCEVFASCDTDGNRLCAPDCHVKGLVRDAQPVQSFDMRTRTKAGQAIWLNVSTVEIRGPRPRTVHLFRDVTATKELLTLVHERLAPRPPAGDGSSGADLTRRELEVLRTLTEGLDTAAAAARLHVSRATVRNHVQNILRKLAVHSRLEAVAWAVKHRLV